MKSILLSGLLLASAQAQGHGAAAKPAPVVATDARLAPVVALADRFAAAVKAADFDTVRTVLDPRVLILESGGAERSLDEYLAHHAVADAAFLAGATVKVTHRTGDVQGATAWLGTESEITPAAAGQATLLSTETLVFSRASGDWKVVHVHWSSRPKKAVTP